MRVTVIADASWCPDLKVAGYGYWIASNRGDEGGGGIMTTARVGSNITAEMMAIANALHHALLSQLVQTLDSVLFQTDCVAAIDAFIGRRRLYIEDERAVVQYVARTVALYSLDIEYRHVKGHSKLVGARYRANAMCDLRAKTFMRQARAHAICNQLKESS